MTISNFIPCLVGLFLRPATSGPQNVVQMSVHLSSTLLEVTMGFLQHMLNEELSLDMLNLLGSSFLFSTLLPTTLAQLGPQAAQGKPYRILHLCNGEAVGFVVIVTILPFTSVHHTIEPSIKGTLCRLEAYCKDSAKLCICSLALGRSHESLMILCLFIQFSVEVVKRTLPVASAVAQFASRAVQSAGVQQASPAESSTYSDTNLMHYATVETEHPYKQATVSHFKVCCVVS